MWTGPQGTAGKIRTPGVCEPSGEDKFPDETVNVIKQCGCTRISTWVVEEWGSGRGYTASLERKCSRVIIPGERGDILNYFPLIMWLSFFYFKNELMKKGKSNQMNSGGDQWLMDGRRRPHISIPKVVPHGTPMAPAKVVSLSLKSGWAGWRVMAGHCSKEKGWPSPHPVKDLAPKAASLA